MTISDIKCYPNALIMVSLSYIKDGLEMVPILVNQPHRNPGGQWRPEILRKLNKALLVEARLAIEALMPLDIRGMHPEDPRPFRPDTRNKKQRRADAERLVESQLMGVSLETVKMRGRLYAPQQYRVQNNRILYRNIRTNRLPAQRLYSTFVTDLPAGWTPDYFVADCYLRRVKALARAVKMVDDTLEMIRATTAAMERTGETKRRIAVSQGTYVSKFGSSDPEEMHYVSHASGVNAADIWHRRDAQDQREAFDLSILGGKQDRNEPITPADWAFLECRVAPLVQGEIPAATASDRALLEMAQDIIHALKLSDIMRRKLSPTG